MTIAEQVRARQDVQEMTRRALQQLWMCKPDDDELPDLLRAYRGLYGEDVPLPPSD